MTPLPLSNSLTDLAARIKAEHTAIHGLLSDSVERAMAAGDLLIEAKGQLKHGQWLPWLRDHCEISERTAQLYMRCAKNRAEIEKRTKSAMVADLTLNEAAAVLMLSSDAQKLFDFVNSTKTLNAEQIVQAAIDQREALLGVIVDQGYRVFAHCTEAGERDWHLFILYLCLKHGYWPEHAAAHVEYLSQKQFMDPHEWLGPEGARFRRSSREYRQHEMSEGVLRAWAAFKEQYKDRTQAEIIAETEAIDKECGPAPPITKYRPKRRKRAAS
jgi:hypothetical protein